MSNEDKRFDEEFSEEFRNTKVTLTVQEIGEITAHTMAEFVSPEKLNDTEDFQTLMLYGITLDLLRQFGASIMAKMFPDLDDNELIIEPKDKNS